MMVADVGEWRSALEYLACGFVDLCVDVELNQRPGFDIVVAAPPTRQDVATDQWAVFLRPHGAAHQDASHLAPFLEFVEAWRNDVSRSGKY